MKLKELHKDMERYLKFDCYCPNEIYQANGFFYSLFYADDECEKLGVAKGQSIDTIYCVVEETNNHTRKILDVQIDDDKIVDIVQYDATDNNIEIVSRAIKYGIVETIEWMKENQRYINEFEEGATEKSLKQLLELSNGIVMCD